MSCDHCFSAPPTMSAGQMNRTLGRRSSPDPPAADLADPGVVN
jgi:hypothetical protein